LDDSWRQQPGTPVYTTDLNAEGLRKALSAAHRERTRDWTATLKSPGNFATPA
jgi:8-hydroxy-5-deazaflavin:NADPH oxidoreductase